MFEFHGWAVLRYDIYEIETQPEEQLWLEFLQYLSEAAPDYQDIWTVNRLNGSDSFAINGLFNHRNEWVVDIFRWLAENSPGTYGVLYVWDDEDTRNQNKFRVWRLARGNLIEFEDTLLSPCIPTIEDG
jgi:Immunity protein 7